MCSLKKNYCPPSHGHAISNLMDIGTLDHIIVVKVQINDEFLLHMVFILWHPLLCFNFYCFPFGVQRCGVLFFVSTLLFSSTLLKHYCFHFGVQRCTVLFFVSTLLFSLWCPKMWCPLLCFNIIVFFYFVKTLLFSFWCPKMHCPLLCFNIIVFTLVSKDVVTSSLFQHYCIHSSVQRTNEI